MGEVRDLKSKLPGEMSPRTARRTKQSKERQIALNDNERNLKGMPGDELRQPNSILRSKDRRRSRGRADELDYDLRESRRPGSSPRRNSHSGAIGRKASPKR